jgi:hypothetical protein
VKLLFDHNVDQRFRNHIPGHDIRTAREMGWETLGNGALLQSARVGGFDVFISLDKKIEHEQNLITLPLPIVIIDAPSNALPALIPFAPFLHDLIKSPLDRLLFIIEPTGFIHRLSAPRR